MTRPRNCACVSHRFRKAWVWAAALLLPLIFASASFAESGNHGTDRPPAGSGGRVASAK